MAMEDGKAILSSEKNYTIFKFGNHIVRFRSPYSLEHYTEVKEWDDGYMVVMAKYAHNNDVEEEYIDLIPILENLYIDAKSVLKSIRKVEVAYD